MSMEDHYYEYDGEGQSSQENCYIAECSDMLNASAKERYGRKLELLKEKYDIIEEANQKMQMKLYHIRKMIAREERLKRVLINRLLDFGDTYQSVHLQLDEAEESSRPPPTAEELERIERRKESKKRGREREKERKRQKKEALKRAREEAGRSSGAESSTAGNSERVEFHGDNNDGDSSPEAKKSRNDYLS